MRRDGSERGRLSAAFAIPGMAIAGVAMPVPSCGDGAVEPPATPTPLATAVTVSPRSAALTSLEDTARFTAEVRDQSEQVMAAVVVAWASSDPSVAVVDASGLVTAAGNGTATITATAGSASGRTAVTVTIQKAQDRTALEALYNATDGPNWVNNQNRLTDAPLDEWYGVAVDRSDRVEGLRLAYNNLSGEIPPELGDLTNLVRLELRSNLLAGSIPPAFGNLSRLEHLYVRNNRLAGPVPPELGRLTNLVRLELHSNRLSGSIPRSFLQLANLRDLEFDRNDGL